MRNQSNSIREQVSFKLRESHIRDSWNSLATFYKMNKSDVIKFLIKKEEFFLRRPESAPNQFLNDWL